MLSSRFYKLNRECSMNSSALFGRANLAIAGGVNSPVRAFGGVGGDPLFIESAKGAELTDASGRRYIDYVGSWGPMIAGHAHPAVVKAVTEAVGKGLSFGAPTLAEIKLAEKIISLMPSIERIRLMNSGTEATMTAIRLARGYTKRSKIIKFAGCYHGHVDALLVEAGSGVLTLGVPGSAGVSETQVRDTLVADYNRPETVKALFDQHADDIAAIIVEPVAGNMNCVLPIPGFLPKLRELCDQFGALLIFDEVMTGFRVALGGAQAYFGIKPDLTTLGKIIGGGMPVGACGGRSEIMNCLAPMGDVYQAGTLSGNPVAMAAGLATLDLVSEPGFYDRLNTLTHQFMQGLKETALQRDVPLQVTSIGGLFGFYFIEGVLPETLSQVKESNVARFKRFFHGMLQAGVYFAPSAFEAGFMSSAHSEEHLAKTLAAADEVFKMV